MPDSDFHRQIQRNYIAAGISATENNKTALRHLQSQRLSVHRQPRSFAPAWNTKVERKVDGILGEDSKCDPLREWICCLFNDLNCLLLTNNGSYPTRSVEDGCESAVGSTHPHTLHVSRQHACDISGAAGGDEWILRSMIAVWTVKGSGSPVVVRLAGVPR